MRAELIFDHLTHLTTPVGVYEHALGRAPRIEHGYCVDDVARALVVTSREPQPSDHVRGLSETYVAFLLAAQQDDGLMHNRRHVTGSWSDTPSSNDHWGRALWALATATAFGGDPILVAAAHDGASRALRARSRWPRAMAYAALGAGELLRVFPEDRGAWQMLVHARRVLGRPRAVPSWPWPEERLTYANAVLPEAMLVVGEWLDDESLVTDGLSLLRWLVDEQQHDGHLSVVPAGGRAPGDVKPSYAQQPIEISALAEACRRAYLVTGTDGWNVVIAQCLSWFEGANDAGLPMRDAATGGGHDGLERGSVSQNQGAESTLAWLATLQVALMPQLALAR